MKIIVLGASGMLGHVIALYFKKKYPSKIILCSRSKINIKSLDKILLKIPEYSKEKKYICTINTDYPSISWSIFNVIM